MIKVILDANFLFIPSQFRLDIFEQLSHVLGKQAEPLILSPTLNELQKLANSSSIKLRKQASLGLQLSARCHIVEMKRKSGESNDDAIYRAAREMKCPVATNDRELRRRLRMSGIAVVFLRQRSTLALDGSV